MSKNKHQPNQNQGSQHQQRPLVDTPAAPKAADDTTGEASPVDNGDASKVDEQSATSTPQAKSEFHVVGPSSAYVDGEMVPPGKVILLTEEAAKALGKAVRRGRPRFEDYSKRETGSFVVVGPGSVCVGGKFQGPGSVIRLSGEDARKFGGLVKPANP